MAARVLLDTSILAYAYDRAEPEKQHRAIAVLDHLATSGVGWISTQVLGEFFVVATTKLAHPLTFEEAGKQIQHLVGTWPVLDVTPFVVLEAARAVREYRLSYWDAQVWATALLHQSPIVLSEDFRDGWVLEGVRFSNPFRHAFDLERLL